MERRWALVTGASDGIGVEFCRVLAGRGYNLVLVARREQKLREVADAVAAKHGVATHVVPCDLATPHAAEDLHRKTQELGVDVAFLVNNAGLLHNGFFDEIELGKHEDLLAVNVVALTALAHLYARDMAGRGGGHILNVASTAAWIGIPQQNVYAASKAYVLAFSLALGDELRAKKSGVRVTAVCPSYTRTKMLDSPEQGPKLAIPDALVLEAAAVAQEGVDACLRGKPMVVPGLGNRVAMSVVQALPKLWVTRVFGALYRRAQK
jgi:short-subunit dehydrogenase